ncbi:MAG: aldo/keto reductase [Methanobrevibacter sp.]|uniref:aldo/keto reductase n=1 Tax=Methanobrevibacter sp. TaxID=66852 RepID=UPI0025E5D8AF|nr:aldo/keto reductase [Methanobrevibacter sp.]MBE6508526.1 aldo/keto reductase [Methanobrevibacter sp.]
MLMNNFRNSKYEISKFGLGTVQFGLDYGFTKRKTQDEVNAILTTANDNGITLIDTAREYGDSEEKIGNFLQNYKNNFVIATKLRLIEDLDNLNYTNFKNNIYNSVEESLEKLQLDKVPILQLHQAVDEIYKNDDFWTVVNQLKDDNLIDLFGVSVYELQETEFITENHSGSVDFFQIPYNIFDRRFDAIQNQLEENNIGLISRSTFLKGIIPCDIDDVPEGLEKIKPFKQDLIDIANKCDVSAAELASVFVYYNNYINSTILGVNSPEELETNIKSIDKFDKTLLEDIDFDSLRINDDYLIDPRKWNNF